MEGCGHFDKGFRCDQAIVLTVGEGRGSLGDNPDLQPGEMVKNHNLFRSDGLLERQNCGCGWLRGSPNVTLFLTSCYLTASL